MTNYPFTKIEEFDDIEVKNAWQAEVLTKQVDAAEYIAHLRNQPRPLPTPMQWDDSANGGLLPVPKHGLR